MVAGLDVEKTAIGFLYKTSVESNFGYTINVQFGNGSISRASAVREVLCGRGSLKYELKRNEQCAEFRNQYLRSSGSIPNLLKYFENKSSFIEDFFELNFYDLCLEASLALR